jgi:hypothetical protein
MFFFPRFQWPAEPTEDNGEGDLPRLLAPGTKQEPRAFVLSSDAYREAGIDGCGSTFETTLTSIDDLLARRRSGSKEKTAVASQSPNLGSGGR